MIIIAIYFHYCQLASACMHVEMLGCYYDGLRKGKITSILPYSETRAAQIRKALWGAGKGSHLACYLEFRKGG